MRRFASTRVLLHCGSLANFRPRTDLSAACIICPAMRPWVSFMRADAGEKPVPALAQRRRDGRGHARIGVGDVERSIGLAHAADAVALAQVEVPVDGIAGLRDGVGHETVLRALAVHGDDQTGACRAGDVVGSRLDDGFDAGRRRPGEAAGRADDGDANQDRHAHAIIPHGAAMRPQADDGFNDALVNRRPSPASVVAGGRSRRPGRRVHMSW